jgi:three-Cys-motif partner protein
MKSPPDFDQIGAWSELKLEILKKYAKAYSVILNAQKDLPLSHVYIDAFAGMGLHVSKATGEPISGSPLNALAVQPPFREYHLIDLVPEKVESLRKLIGVRNDVFIYQGDCNEILLDKVFPCVRYENYRRGLCVLDPYGLHLDWNIISTAGQMKSLDMFLNFPVQDMNRNVFWKNPEAVKEDQIARMNRFWGDESWRNVAYATNRNLFNDPEKEPNEVIARAFRQRLKEVASFPYVPEPLPMRNSRGAIIYYLFFASQKAKAQKIAEEIFSKYRSQRR